MIFDMLSTYEGVNNIRSPRLCFNGQEKMAKALPLDVPAGDQVWMESGVLKELASFLFLAVVSLLIQDSSVRGPDHFLLWNENPMIEALTDSRMKPRLRG